MIKWNLPSLGSRVYTRAGPGVKAHALVIGWLPLCMIYRRHLLAVFFIYIAQPRLNLEYAHAPAWSHGTGPVGLRGCKPQPRSNPHFRLLRKIVLFSLKLKALIGHMNKRLRFDFRGTNSHIYISSRTSKSTVRNVIAGLCFIFRPGLS